MSLGLQKKMSSERIPLLSTPVNRSNSVVFSWQEIIENYVRPCCAEFLGVALFVFIGCTSVYNTQNIVGVAIAHGLTIALLVTATGAISGGQLNPAVTLALFISREITAVKALLFVLAQVVGGITGAAICKGVLDDVAYRSIQGGAQDLGKGTTIGEGVLCEVMLTALLVTVILLTAVDPETKSTLAPLAIGFTVVVDILAGGTLTGASMNPARSFGPAVVSNAWNNHWIYWVGPGVGALWAVFIYRLILASPEKRFLRLYSSN
ncbi:unnamed protein product [Lymnaea stagnalis]|uniref:Aquaporin n=1 Tax=Lymnaea stagnalis TaxID=6523 RepID=A0AAV2H543_LYMST